MAVNKQLDTQGEAAKRLYEKMEAAQGSYNERRKVQSRKLKEALAPVWAALEDGRTVNGCKTKVEWARWVNPIAKCPERWLYSIMQDEKGLKSLQSKRKKKGPVVVHVGKGTQVEIDEQWYYVTNVNVKLDGSNQHRAVIALEAMVRSTHVPKGDGPACKPDYMRKRSFKTEDYPYAKKGEKPTCEFCLNAVEKLKAQVATA